MTTAAAAASERAMTFEELFLREYARVVSIARRIVGDTASGEDVAQDVFAAFARRVSPNHPNASGWLYLAAARLALNEVRRRHRSDRRARAVFHLNRSRDSVFEDTHDPQTLLERAEIQSLVHHAMRRLPKRSAMLLALRYGGLSYNEIAQVMRIEPAHVGTYLARAQRAFRKEIEHVYPH